MNILLVLVFHNICLLWRMDVYFIYKTLASSDVINRCFETNTKSMSIHVIVINIINLNHTMCQNLYELQRNQQKLEAEELKRRPKTFVPNSNYKDKYVHLIGQEAALSAARKTETNKSYGFGKISLQQFFNFSLSSLPFSTQREQERLSLNWTNNERYSSKETIKSSTRNAKQ